MPRVGVSAIQFLSTSVAFRSARVQRENSTSRLIQANGSTWSLLRCKLLLPSRIRSFGLLNGVCGLRARDRTSSHAFVRHMAKAGRLLRRRPIYSSLRSAKIYFPSSHWACYSSGTHMSSRQMETCCTSRTMNTVGQQSSQPPNKSLDPTRTEEPCRAAYSFQRSPTAIGSGCWRSRTFTGKPAIPRNKQGQVYKFDYKQRLSPISSPALQKD